MHAQPTSDEKPLFPEPPTFTVAVFVIMGVIGVLAVGLFLVSGGRL